MKTIDVQQGSVEWVLARCGIPTASEFDQLFTTKFEPRKGEMPKTYLARKLAEKWTGGPLPGYNTLEMEFGQILQDEAIPFAELEYRLEIQSVGLVTTDDGKIGCSPDGLIGGYGGIEVKCPAPQTHTKWLLEDKVPDEHLAQVHGSLFVTGRQEWRFMSYRRHFPPLMKVVEANEATLTVMGEVLGDFTEKLEAAFKRLCEINGGPPRRRVSYSQPAPSNGESDYQRQTGDIIP